jgi:NADP-dependent aldehyde dehydrogenase
VRTGKWKDIRIDPAMPDRKPLRRADLRRTLIPIGPVAVWAASNFPLAFSVAGGDTASALAAGCPVILKAHPGHPKTSEMVAAAIRKAVTALGLPDGVFGLVQGASPDVSLELVRHPGVQAGAFTGSLRAGRALFEAAAQRPEPIPFFAEMGSVNPVFVLPGALAERADAIAEGLAQSVNMGVGQFCTCPGIVAGMGLDGFAEQLRARFAQAKAGTMLTPAIAKSYCEAVDLIEATAGVRTTRGAGEGPQPALFEVDAATFLAHPEFRHEVFGPSTLLVNCATQPQLEQVARSLEGSLTATLHGTEDDLRSQPTLLTILTRKAGRLVFNGFPTGVEVCAAMQHGGPYPSTTDPRFTSVGTAAIARFARPICYQDFPAEFLPAELR